MSIHSCAETDTQWSARYAPEFKAVIACIRGTELNKLKDVITDARFIPTQLPKAPKSCKVHRGFLAAVQSIESEFIATVKSLMEINSCKTAWFFGHSMGAAEIIIATWLFWKKTKIKPEFVVGYGGPAIFNKVAQKTVNADLWDNTVRFGIEDDFVVNMIEAIYDGAGEFIKLPLAHGRKTVLMNHGTYSNIMAAAFRHDTLWYKMLINEGW